MPKLQEKCLCWFFLVADIPLECGKLLINKNVICHINFGTDMCCILVLVTNTLHLVLKIFVTFLINIEVKRKLII